MTRYIRQSVSHNLAVARRLSRRDFLRFTGAGVGLAFASGMLAACGGGGGANEQVTLQLVGNTTLEDPTQSVIDAFSNQNPNITFNESFAPNDQLQTQIRTQLGGGNPPDIFSAWPGNGNSMAIENLAPAGLLADFSGQSWVESIPEQLRPVFEVDGEVYFFTPSQGAIGTIYNKQVFEDLDLEIPETWDELMSTCETIRGEDIHPIAVGYGESFVTTLINYALVASTVFADDPDFADRHLAGEVSFSDSGWREALEKHLELNERGYFNPSPNGTSYEQQLQMVGNGDAAMAVQVSASFPQVEGYGEEGQFGMFAFPGVDDPSKVWVPAAAANGFGVSPDSEYVDEARSLIEFMGEQGNMTEFAEAAGELPLILPEGYEPAPQWELLVPFIEEGKSVPFMGQRWPNPELQQVHTSVIQEMFSGEIGVDEALREMDETFEED